MRYWFLLRPDISRPIGGVKQIHRLVESIASTGRSAVIIQDDKDFHPGWFTSNVETISFDDWTNLSLRGFDKSANCLVVPETLAACVFSYSKIIPIVIFNQNGSYSFGVPSSKSIFKPSALINLYRSDFVHHFICVSEYDHSLLSGPFGVPDNRISLIRNGIESQNFSLNVLKSKTISYMPRKNVFDANVVTSLLNNQSWLDGWKIIPIKNSSHQQVISTLSSSLIFLSFGHPEGFGLPIAEALAAGCFVVGYSGLGGRELFNIGSKFNVAFDIPIGDWVGFLSAVQHVVQSIEHEASTIRSRLSNSSNLIRDTYSLEAMSVSVVKALSAIESRIC